VAADREPPHVLIVNDAAAILDLYRDLLEDDGYRVTAWTYPESDPLGVRAVGPDVVVLDLLFGREAAGLGFLQRLKADPTTASIPVLLSSADPALLERAREELAAWDCGAVRKPFEVEEFLAAIRACLAKAPRT
jgi:DNA-binding response OmpR family regulator